MIVKILDIGSSLEAIAIRSVLESFNIKVEISFIGRPNQFIQEINDSSNKYIIICGHGEKNKFLMPILADDIYEKDEPIHITSEVVNEKISISNKVIISTCCATGTKELANAFTSKGNLYVAPTDYIDGNAALFFVIKLLYEHMVLNKSIDVSFALAKENDNETKLFNFFK